MFQSQSQLFQEIARAVSGITPNDVAAQMRVRGSRIHLLSRAIRVCQRAEITASSYGCIGVGVIAFRNARLRRFIQHLNRKGIAP